MRLKDKTVVVTGAASGVGRATSWLFAQHGAEVVCVDMDELDGEGTAAEIRRRGGRASYLHADVGDAASVRTMAGRCMEQHPRIHVLFNNAGMLVRDSFETVRLEDWHRTIAVNLTGPYLCSAALLPALKAAQGASIIHHGSIDAVMGNPTAASYSVSKGGLVPLTHVMAHTLGRYGIRVNCINSGALFESDSGIPVRLTPELRSGTHQRVNGRILATPLGRAGRVEECAAAALYLASGESSYMTGSMLTVDGGRTAITPGTAAMDWAGKETS